MQGLRYKVVPFGIDVALMQPCPFGTELLASGKAPEHTDVLASYGNCRVFPMQWASTSQQPCKVMRHPSHN